MKICSLCGKGRHSECNGLILKIEKRSFMMGYRNIKISNICECSCNQIKNESTEHYREKLGPDIQSEYTRG